MELFRFSMHFAFMIGLVPSIYGAGVCNDNVVSGLPDSAITASSVFGIKDKSNNYGPERAKLNLTETKDAAGVTQAGAWVAEKGNLMQWIQVELKEPTLIRGVTTQGRNGCCQQWVSKYRVLHSMDCQSWTTVGGFNVTDAFFKGNSDADTPVTNMFQCPVIAKCIRINPLDWKNNIGMRLDLIGCPLGNKQQTTTQTKPTTTPLVVTTKAAVTTGGAITTTNKQVITTKSGAINVNTGAITTKAKAQVTTPKPGALSGGPKNCIKSCQGKPNGNYQSCKGCDVFVTCNWSSMYPDRPCPRGLKWDDKQKKCDFKSSTCP